MAGRNKFDVNVDLNKLFDRRSSMVDDLDKLAQAVEDGVEKGLVEFGDRLVDKLIENLEKHGLGDSALQSQIQLEVKSDSIRLRIPTADGDYAMFVEYGTGVVGLDGTSHPWANRYGWEYDSNDHGQMGWWYPTVQSDPNPTKYLTREGFWKAWTRGSEARPFMYDTWLWARQSFTHTMNRYIRKEIAEWSDDVNAS